jgi:DNA/RNA endonuclease YhcR with UshA esterase domain
MKHIFFLFLFVPLFLYGQSHLLITEIQATPKDSSFIEIYNPTDAAIDLSNVYLADYNTYYDMVNASYTTNSQDFLVRFPAGSSVAGKTAVVVALNGSGFGIKYGFDADYEILSTSASTTDMISLAGTSTSQINTQEMLVMFEWDGQSDLVADIDYAAWGLFSSNFVDKSGISVDGPDADATATAYQNDTPVASQSALAALTDEILSVQRTGTGEGAEAASNGNGQTGHDETSEDLVNQFELALPTPGLVKENPGDGSGFVTVEPDSMMTGTSGDLVFSISGEETYTIASLEINIPAGWSWSGNASDVEFSGTGLNGATLTAAAGKASFTNCAVTSADLGTVTLKNLTAPDNPANAVFTVQTAVPNGTLSPITNSPVVRVWNVVTIADIQNNPAIYIGTQVSFQAVVTVGAGVISTAWTDAYIQDNSGRGINVYRSGLPVDTDLEVGNLVTISGTVDEFSGVTEIVDYSLTIDATGQPLPEPLQLTTQQANNLSLEGTYVRTVGIVTDKYATGTTGSNLIVDDGSGSITIRVWTTTNVNISGYNIGDTVAVTGVMDIYTSAAQILLSYQDDIGFAQITSTGNGSGVVTVTPDMVETDASTALTFDVSFLTADTVGTLELDVPSYWTWSQSAGDISLAGGLSNATVAVNNMTVTLSGFELNSETPGNFTVSGLTAPSADTMSVFAVRTAGIGGTLTAIGSSPVVQVGAGTGRTITSLGEIQQNIDLWNGKTVNVRGIVTIGAGVLRTDFSTAYIMDESGYGIQLFSFNAPDPDIVRGNDVLVTGTIEEYNGTTELTGYTATVIRQNQPLPDPVELTTGEATGLNYEGSMVQVSGTIVEKYYAGGGTNINVDDGSGVVTLRIWDTAGLALDEFEAGDGIVARGIISPYSGIGQILVGYQEDLEFIVLPKSPVMLQVPNKPFVPDQGERLEITYSAGTETSHIIIRLYDIAGRLQATLLDDSGRSFQQTMKWDGRDQINELVPLGTYILHLEVVDEVSGNKTTKIAPVVVGTVLSR